MPTIDSEETLDQHVLSIRISGKLKDDITYLMRLEKRKLSNMAMLLIEEAVPLKNKIHDQKNQLMPIRSEHGERVLIQRVALEGDEGNYKMKPGLGISFVDKDGNGPSSFMIDKSEALTLAANLSIFLNEVNL